MATLTTDQRFTHDNDCVTSGCPGHTLRAQYQSTSDYYSFYIDGEGLFSCDRNTMQSILKAVKMFAASRVEVEADIKASGIDRA